MERRPLNCGKLPWSPNIYMYIYSANNEHKFHGIHELYNLEMVNMFWTCMIRSGGDSCSCPWTQQGSKAAVSKYGIPGNDMRIIMSLIDCLVCVTCAERS